MKKIGSDGGSLPGGQAANNRCSSNSSGAITEVGVYRSVFGPELYTKPFQATAGQALSFDWAAASGGDHYEAYGFLVKLVDSNGNGDFTDETATQIAADGVHYILSYGRSDIAGWSTASGSIPESGWYRFRFVNGTYDGSGGQYLGATMYVDPQVIVGQPNVISFTMPPYLIGGATAQNHTITASASSGGLVNFTSESTTVCTVGSSTLANGISTATVTTLAGLTTGLCKIKANSPFTATHVGATSVVASAPIVPPVNVLSINRVGVSPSSESTISWTVTLDQSVTGLSAANFGLAGSAGAKITGVTGSGTTWTVTVDPGTAVSTVGLNMVNSTGVGSSLGVPVLNLPYTGQTYLIAPRIISVARAGASMTGMDYAEWLVTFNEPVGGMSAANFAIAGSFIPKTSGQVPTIGSVTGSGALWTIRLNIPKGEGAVGLNMTSVTGIVDGDGLGVLQTLPIVGQTIVVISVDAQTTNERVTTRRRRTLIRGASDNLAVEQEGAAERIGNGDLFMRTFTATNSGLSSIPSITLRVRMPLGVRVIPWEFTCSKAGPCTISSPRSDRALLTVPGGTPAAGVGSALEQQEIRWTGSLGPSESITVTAYVQMSNEALSGETNLADIQLVDNMDMTVAIFVDIQPKTMSYLPMAPGALTAGIGTLSGQRPASLLIYPLYTSAVNLALQDSRFTLTNASPDLTSYVHLFFVDGADCSVADMFVTLTASQTISFLASDLDPTITGYLVAVAVDEYGFPQHFNHLLGSVFVKFESGHAANLSAVGVAALAGGMRPVMTFESDTTMDLYLDGISYSEVPRTLALSNVPSRADGNQTMMVINRIGGDFSGRGGSALSALYGLLFDDRETAASYTVPGGSCQIRVVINGTSVRTTPRIDTLIPAGRSGWMKISSINDEGILGAMINYSPNGFNQGHLLHALTTTRSVVIKVPIVPPTL